MQNENESRIQQSIVEWYNNEYCRKIIDGIPNPCRSLIYHVPNQNQHRLVAIGVLSGVSDLVVVHRSSPKHTGIHLYIEVKDTIGKQSPNQIEFQQRIESLGYKYFLVRSLDEFKLIISLFNERN